MGHGRIHEAGPRCQPDVWDRQPRLLPTRVRSTCTTTSIPLKIDRDSCTSALEHVGTT